MCGWLLYLGHKTVSSLKVLIRIDGEMESYGFRNLGFGYLSFGSGFVGNLVVLVMEEENEQYSDTRAYAEKYTAYAPLLRVGLQEMPVDLRNG